MQFDSAAPVAGYIIDTAYSGARDSLFCTVGIAIETRDVSSLEIFSVSKSRDIIVETRDLKFALHTLIFHVLKSLDLDIL